MVEKPLATSVGDIIAFQQNVPVVTGVDVLVVGGGPAGIAAAIAAARAGARTALVERYGFLGGNATVGLVGEYMLCRGSGFGPVVP